MPVRVNRQVVLSLLISPITVFLFFGKTRKMKDFVFFEFSTPHPWNMFLLLWLCFFFEPRNVFCRRQLIFWGQAACAFSTCRSPNKISLRPSNFRLKNIHPGPGSGQGSPDLEVVKARLTWKWSRLA